MSQKKTQIIILGGGFGGMYCALELEKALARGDSFLSQPAGRHAAAGAGASRRGVEIRGNTKVASVTERGVKLTDGECIDTFNIVWTAGTSPNPHLNGLPCLKERGRVCVNEFLEVAERTSSNSRPCGRKAFPTRKRSFQNRRSLRNDMRLSFRSVSACGWSQKWHSTFCLVASTGMTSRAPVAQLDRASDF